MFHPAKLSQRETNESDSDNDNEVSVSTAGTGNFEKLSDSEVTDIVDQQTELGPECSSNDKNDVSELF